MSERCPRVIRVGSRCGYGLDMLRRIVPDLGFGRACALMLASGLVLVACSSSGSSQTSAEEQVCAARTEVQTSFQKVADDLKTLNFGQAKSDAPAVKTALDGLVTAQSKLNDATRAKIEPDVTTLKSSLASVQSATTLAQAGAALDSAKAAFQSALQSIGDTANCS